MAGWQTAFNHLLPGEALAFQTALFKIAGSYVVPPDHNKMVLQSSDDPPAPIQCGTEEEWWLYTVAFAFCLLMVCSFRSSSGLFPVLVPYQFTV